MKRALSISVVLVAAISPAWGQLLSSHAAAASPTPKPAVVSAPSPTGKPVARVNGAVLTYGDLMREEYTIFPYARQHNGSIPAAMQSDIQTGAMKMIVFEELVYQEAQRRKIDDSPARLQRAEAEFRKQFASQQEYQDLLNSEFKGSKKLLQTKIERSLLIDELLKTEVSNRAYIALAQLRAYYDKNPQQFNIPESFRRADDLCDSSGECQSRSAKSRAQESRRRASPGSGDKELRRFRRAGRKTFRRRFSRDDGRPPRRRSNEVAAAGVAGD